MNIIKDFVENKAKYSKRPRPDGEGVVYERTVESTEAVPVSVVELTGELARIDQEIARLQRELEDLRQKKKDARDMRRDLIESEEAKK